MKLLQKTPLNKVHHDLKARMIDFDGFELPVSYTEEKMKEVFEWMDEWGPEKVVVVYDTRTQMKGMLVIDNTARGMGKGGCRMAPDVSLWDCFRLARNMTWKWAIADINLGGAKAAIVADPRSPNKEEILRAFVRAIRKFLPNEYVFGNDMGISERDAAIVVDECGGDMRVATGTPAGLGGLPYDELGLTGYGVAEATEVGAEYFGINLREATISIQGLGAVGSFTAKFLHEKGARIVAVSGTRGALYEPSGLDVKQLMRLKKEFGREAVKKYEGGRLIPLGDELTLDVDILIPAAKGDVITKQNVDGVKAKMIVEAANFPIIPGCQKKLNKKGIILIPDILANSGAVIGVGKSMLYRYACERVDLGDVYESIKSKMRSNVTMVLSEATKTNRLPVDVALDIAKERVLEAMKLRGRIPRRV